MLLLKERNFAKANKSNYHLVTIYKKLEDDTESIKGRSVSIYLDGVLEGTFPIFTSSGANPSIPNNLFKSFTIYPNNCFINLVEYSCFAHNSLIREEAGGVTIVDSRASRTYLTENNILGYYYSYDEKLLGHGITEHSTPEEIEAY